VKGTQSRIAGTGVYLEQGISLDREKVEMYLTPNVAHSTNLLGKNVICILRRTQLAPAIIRTAQRRANFKNALAYSNSHTGANWLEQFLVDLMKSF
jgi:hypothetical protein